MNKWTNVSAGVAFLLMAAMTRPSETILCVSALICLLIGLLLLNPAITHAATEIGTSTDLATKVDILENINLKILNTIYWVIGTLAALFAGVIGLNIYSNYKLNTEKYLQLKKEIETGIESKFEEADKKSRTAVESAMKSQGSGIEARLTAKLAPLTEAVEEQKRESILGQIERHEKRGERGAIICRIDLLEVDIKKGWDWRIADTLNDLQKYVGENKIDSDVALDLQKALNKLPSEFVKQKAAIESKIDIS